MKKVLLATTALTLSAGIAAADGHTGVKVSGFAEMGIADNGTDDVQFFQDIDVTFSMSGETDNGLSFGAAVDLDEAQDSCDVDSATGGDDGAGGSCVNDALDDTTEDGGVAIFISGDFGTLTMGDTDGALDWAMTEVASLGSIADDHTAHAGYSGNAHLDGSTDGQIVRYDNTVGDFSFAVSLEQDVPGTGEGDTFGIGAKGSFGDISVGLGYQENDVDDRTGISVGAGLGDIDVVVNYSTGENAGVDFDHTDLGLTYSSGALGLHVNYDQFDRGGVDSDGVGLAVNYGLGGGAEVQFGYGDGEGTTTWSLGVAMSF